MHHNIPRRAIGSLGLRQRVHLTLQMQRFSCFPLSKYSGFSVHEPTGVTNTQSCQRINCLRSLQLGTAIPASPACPARQASQHSHPCQPQLAQPSKLAIQQPETLSDLTNFVPFGQVFCQDLDLAILLHHGVHLAQIELYQRDLLDGTYGLPMGLV